MSRPNGGWPRLPLEALSDVELLLIFEDAADADGGATAIAVAELTDEGLRAARSIGGRFAWLKRWGYMEQEEDKRWFLTPEGEALRKGSQLNARQELSARRLAESATLGLADVLGGSLDADARRMIRRGLRHHEVRMR